MRKLFNETRGYLYFSLNLRSYNNHKREMGNLYNQTRSNNVTLV